MFITGKCNWCGLTKTRVPGKRFCIECGEKGRECKWCRKPKPERFYSTKVDVCNSCITRRDSYVQRGGGAKQEALDGAVATHTFIPTDVEKHDIMQLFNSKEKDIKIILSDGLEEKKGIKWFLTIQCKFKKYNVENEVIAVADPVFRSFNYRLTLDSDMSEQLAKAYQKLYKSMDEFQGEGSGWILDTILKMEVNVAEYIPIQGSSYVPLPKKLEQKKAILNIHNSDQRCFLWSVLAGIHPVHRKDHANRVSNYSPYVNEINLTGIEFPMSLNKISKFESQNNISINVFGWEDNEVFPLYVTEKKYNQHVNLILISKGEARHFCLVRNLSRLLGDRTNHNGAMHYCNYCLHGFIRESLLIDHVPYCSTHAPQKIQMPDKEEDRWVKFKDYAKGLKVPFTIFADFECFTRKISSCSPSQNTSSTTPYQKHEPSGFGYVVVSSDPAYHKQAVVYRGDNVVDNFIEHMLNEEQEIIQTLSNMKPIKLTAQEENDFQKASHCHICEQLLGADRVRDHDHLNGRYRGAAHNACNLNFKYKKENEKKPNSFHIPIIFHNLSRYDLHVLMTSIGKVKNKRLSCIPNNMERYISFSLGNLRFIDSLQFLNTSLDTLVDNMSKDGTHKFQHLKRHFSEIDLLVRKGVFPYDYWDQEEKSLENRLPPKEAFYSTLTKTTISDDDYNHAQQVWDRFKLSDLGEYHDLYLKTDVLLLADVFEEFRTMCLASYKLDPVHYYTAPGLAWDAMLKMTGVHLELITDQNMYLMIEQGIRGGVSTVCQKFAKANNPYLADYDPKQPTSYLLYLDANNLYGWSMIQSLPQSDFCWLSDDQIAGLDIISVPDDSDTGYICEVDLECPQSLHELYNDLPLAPEAINVSDDMLSPHTKRLQEVLGVKQAHTKKLIPNLRNKNNYILHYRNLKQYLSLGMKMTKVHRVVSFTQSPWMKPYIDFNTNKRKMASSDFEKCFWKLMVNSTFGKAMENLRKRVNVELVNTKKRLRKLTAKPGFQSFKIFNDDLAAVHSSYVKLYLNRPTYVGFCILDISKTLMYDFHYNVIKTEYGNNAKLVLTDTDSLLYHVKCEDIYKDLLINAHLYDTSNYPIDHPLHSNVNKKVLGKFKDELGGLIMEEACGLRSKMYSLKYGRNEKKTAKGVNRSVTEQELKHEMYKNSLFNEKIQMTSMNQIRSINHNLYTVELHKIGLSPYDDKRFVLEDGIHTLAYGHFQCAQL